MPSVNYLSVLLAAVDSMALGYLWYVPVFGKMWMKLSGLSMDKMQGAKDKMMQMYLIQYVGAVVLAYVVAVFLGLTNMSPLSGAFTLAFWAWLGFQATRSLGTVL